MTATPAPRAGAVLIVVLWACLGLVSVTLLAGHQMVFALRGADNALAGRQAEHAIEGALRYAAAVIGELEVPGQLPLIEDYEAEAVWVGDARFWFIDRPPSTYTGAEPYYGLQDEAAKLNLNTATREMLEALPNMTPEFAGAIVDWRDSDDEISENGAESETYLLGQPAYECKNAPFETVDELLLVAGATPELLYGDDVNRNGVQDPDESPDDGRFDLGLAACLTLYSREPNRRADGSARLAVSSADETLQQLLTDALGNDRGTTVFQTLSGLSEQDRSSLAAVYLASGMTAEEFDLVAPDLAVSDASFFPGLVNVNTAPEEVLAALPGITTDLASTLVAQRATRSEPRPSVAWAVDILGEEAAREAGPFLTAQTWQVAVDVAAVGRYGRGYRRTFAVLDLSEDEPRVVYRRDLDAAGWALGEQTYEDLRNEGGRG